MEAIPLLMRFIRADMRTHSADSLSIPQLRSLAFLKRNSGASLSEVAEHLGVTCATASTAIERLVQRHLIQRADHPQERRCSVFISASNELGSFESGLAAALFGPVLAVVGGGIGTILVVIATACIWSDIRNLGTLEEYKKH